MGTRADFYVGRGASAEWLGSVAYDGYPSGVDKEVLSATDEAAYRKAVARFISGAGHGTKPHHGWPWPWEDSRLTDYAYAFDNGDVYASSFGRSWFDPEAGDQEGDKYASSPKTSIFPDMTARRRLTLGARSGLLVLSGPSDDE